MLGQDTENAQVRVRAASVPGNGDPGSDGQGYALVAIGDFQRPVIQSLSASRAGLGEELRDVEVRGSGFLPGMELDLRGQQVDEALENLGYFLDKAFLAGLPWARIIHGMGTGRLRKAVRNVLKAHSQVDHFEPGKEGEGGDGVSVVSFLE